MPESFRKPLAALVLLALAGQAPGFFCPLDRNEGRRPEAAPVPPRPARVTPLPPPPPVEAPPVDGYLGRGAPPRPRTEAAPPRWRPDR